MSLPACFKSALVYFRSTGLSHLRISKGELTKGEHLSHRFKQFIKVVSFRQRTSSASHAYVVGNSQSTLADCASDARLDFINFVVTKMAYRNDNGDRDDEHYKAGHPRTGRCKNHCHQPKSRAHAIQHKRYLSLRPAPG